MKLKIQRLHPDAIVPRYASHGAAAFDLHAIINGYGAVAIHPGDKVTFRTGLAVEIPEGHGMFILSRSGHGFKNDIRLANCVGLIDSDYRGEIMVKLTSDDLPMLNHFGGPDAVTTFMRVSHGDRIAQAVILPVPRVEFELVHELSTTARGAGGFGSTGA